MAAPRAQWKGFLKLALLTCSVALYTASSRSERISLHMLNRKTGHRLKRDFVDESTGKLVPREEQVKGFEVDSGDYVTVTQDEIDAAIPHSTKTISIETFIPLDEVDPVYVDSPYYLAPVSAADAEVFQLIQDAMEAEKVAGLARTVLFRRDRVLLLRPEGKGMVASTLHYDYEVRSAAEVFADVPKARTKGEMLELAEHIIETKTGKMTFGDFEDRYETALADLIKAKREGRKIPIPAKPKAGNVVNLLDALRESAGKKAGKAPRKQAAARASKRGVRAKAATKRKAG